MAYSYKYIIFFIFLSKKKVITLAYQSINKVSFLSALVLGYFNMQST